MSDKRDNVSRIKASSPLGTSLSVGLRAVDIFIQSGFLAQGLASPFLNASPSPARPTPLHPS